MKDNILEKLSEALPFKLSSRELIHEADIDYDEARRIIAEGFKAVALEEIIRASTRLSTEASLSRFIKPVAERLGMSDVKLEMELSHIQDRMGFRIRLYKAF